MSLQGVHLFLLVFGVISTMAQIQNPSEERKVSSGSPTFDVQHDGVKIEQKYFEMTKNDQKESNGDLVFPDIDSEDSGPVLQTRGKDSDKKKGGKPKSNPKTGVSTAAATDNTVKIKFDKFVESSLQGLTGHFLKMNVHKVRATVVSPRGPQVVGFKGNTVYVNNHIVCENFNSLEPTRKYQKRQDGSMWYTNLKVGKEMKQKTIEKFKRRMAEIENAKPEGKKRPSLQTRDLKAESQEAMDDEKDKENNPFVEMFDLKKTREKNGDKSFVLQARGNEDDNVASFNFNDDNFDYSVSSLGSLSGHFLSLNLEGVRAQVVSPKGPQIVAFAGKKVFVNDQPVCENFEHLSDKRTFQKREDSSMWYTNMRVGKEMTPQQVKQFQRARARIQTEMKDSSVLQSRDIDDDKDRSDVASYNIIGDDSGISANSLQSPSGHYLSLNLDGVRTVAISPFISQTLKFIGKKVFVNDKTVCEDTSSLNPKRTYQIRDDGSIWYTNLQLGQKMTPEQAEEFKRLKEKIQAEMEDNSPLLQTRGIKSDGNVADINVNDEKYDYCATSLNSPSGDYLSVNLNGVSAETISTFGAQSVGFSQKEIFVNNVVVCKNTDNLTVKRTYQKRSDGSVWYSNLRVGKAMNTNEIKAFKNKKAKILAEMANAKEAQEKNSILQTRSHDEDTTSNVASFDFNDDQFDYSACSLLSPSGHYLSLNLEGIRAEVISPQGIQKIGFSGKKVFVKNRVVCEDIENLSDKRIYQKAEDGSMWFTNLNVGKEMTQKEVDDFKKEKKLIQAIVESNPVLQTRGEVNDSLNIKFDYSKRTLESPSGYYLSMDMNGVRAEVVSPINPQVVGFKGKQVFVNNKVACADIGNISAKQIYQKADKDGSMWYTNLQVGKEMTTNEISEFKSEKEKLLDEIYGTGEAASITGKRDVNNNGCWLRRLWSWYW